MMRFGVRALLLLAVAACAHTQETSAQIVQGQRVFREQGCYGCHTVGAMGTSIGPDLSKVGARHDRPYLIGWLRDPLSQKPTAHMPKLLLSDAEIEALAAYLGSLR